MNKQLLNSYFKIRLLNVDNNNQEYTNKFKKLE